VPELTEEQKRNIADFQAFQQQLQLVLLQRQQVAIQLAEAKRAAEEVKKSEGGLYRFAGTVLVPKKREELEKELASEAEALEARQGVLQKQEEKIRERLQVLAKKLEELEKPQSSARG